MLCLILIYTGKKCQGLPSAACGLKAMSNPFNTHLPESILQKDGILVPIFLTLSLKVCVHRPFNSLPNNKILDWSKLKAFANNKINYFNSEVVLGRVENIVGKGEKAGYQHFFPPEYFQKAPFQSH